MGSPSRISNYAAAGVAQLIGMYSKPRGAIVPLLPVILGITPNAGVGGALIRITGYNFEVVSAVTIGGVACTGLVVGGGIITCYAPSGTGAQTLAITGPAGTATLANAFTYASATPAATVTLVNYAVADKAGGDTVQVTGANFYTSVTIFRFGTTVVSGAGVMALDASHANVVVPSLASGSQPISASNDGGATWSSTIAFTAWSPVDLTLTTLRRASYAGVPWAGQASAGTSTGRNLTQANGAKVPATGAAVNGKTPAAFTTVGTSRLDDTTIGTAFGSTYSGVALVYIGSISNTSAAAKNSSASIASSQASGRFAVYLQSDSGGKIAVYHFDAGGLDATTTPVVIGTGAYKLVHWKYDGTNISIGWNGTWQTAAAVAAPNASNSTFTLQWGESTGANAWLDGTILENATMAAVIADADLAKWTTYANCKYGLSMS